MVLFNFGLLIRAGLLIVGLWWCKEILGRWREDVAELKVPDSTRRGVILALWAVTIVVLVLIVIFLWGITATVIHAWKHPVV